MSCLSTVEARLPPGFRFHPRDDELICDYLMKWVRGCAHQSPLLIEVDLNKCEPWDIPETACVGSKEWYFYSQRDRKYATGVRTNRATISGYWKATGKDRPVFRKGILVGMRKTLVFYQGRAPKGSKTDWVMHEFRVEGALGPGPKIAPTIKEDCVLCRVFHKNTTAEVAAKQDTTGSSAKYDHITTSSSPSLPELVEPYATFDHSQAGANVVNEQVSCFSILTHFQTNPTSSLIDPCPEILPTKSMVPNSTGILFPRNIGESSCPNSHHDKNALKAVLNHLTKMDSNNYGILMKDSRSFAEGSPDSYLSEVGLSSMWNQYS